MRINQFIAAGVAAGLLSLPAFAQSGEKDKDKNKTKPVKTAATVLMRGGSYLGVGVADIDGERAKALKLNEERGVEVKRVDDDSPAAKAGLKAGDVVLEFNGQRVESTEQFSRLVRETPAGRQARMLISRDGKQQKLTATIGTRTNQFIARGPDGSSWSFPIPAIPPVPPTPPGTRSGQWWGVAPDVPSGMMGWRSGVLGIETEALGSQLAQFFGVKSGVLVRSVSQNSPAEKAGLKAGDVIVKVGDAAIDSPNELSREVRNARRSGQVSVTISRERKEMNITVELAGETGQGIAFAGTFC